MVLSKRDLNMEDSGVAPVRVAVRIRPLLATDRPHDVCAYATPHQPPQPDHIILEKGVHEFDHAFNPNATQSEVFQTSVAPLMDQLLQGFDTSIVMYGHSSTGKTHTLFGPGVHCVYSEAEYGVIPRAIRYIYGKLMKARNVRFSVKVTFLEVSNDSIRDLLASNQYEEDVVLEENAEGYPVVLGVEEVKCENVSEVINCLHAGMNARQMTWNMDGHSACHYVFQILLEQKWVTAEGLEETRLSLATFADLSSVSHSLSREMDCGLIALNNVVTSLTQWHSKDAFYQQSVLTRLLKESFGGRCYSLVICCISPSSLNFGDSLLTLRFADRVKNVQNFPKVSALLRVVEQTNGKEIEGEGDPANADTFRLEFAAAQWYKLVHNAEGLFKTLVSKNLLSEGEKEQVQQWLCLKEECEEVVASDEETGPTEKDNRLEKIDEVTETEDKTDSSKDGESPPKPVDPYEEKESSSETEDESEADNQRPDFHERLEEHMDKLRVTMEEAVAIHEDILQIPEIEEMDSQIEEANVHPVRMWFPRAQRRRSVDPETDRPLMRLAQQNVCAQTNPEIEEEVEEEEASRPQQTQEITPPRATLQHLDPQQQLKLLSAANEAKQRQIKEVLVDLEGATNQLAELQRTIQIKEEFITDMMKNSDTRTNAKQRCQRKRTKLTEAYYKIMAQLTQAERALSVTNSLNEDKAKLKKEVEKYNKQAKHYDKQIKRVEAVKQIAADSAKKALELENSLQASRRQMEKLKQRVQRAEARKVSLEEELLQDQHKIKELEYKFQQQEQELEREKSIASSTEGERMQRLQAEMRESSQRFQEQLIQQQSILEKREAFLKDKICLEKQRNKSIMEVSARISHLDQVLKEKSTDLEHIKDTHEKEALRLEIRNLRSTRHCLVEQRCTLGTKFQKDKTLSSLEERKLLECDEAIEAIDAVIEYKNQLICGGEGGLDRDRSTHEKGERMLIACLLELSPMEMRMLLYKYFQKVLDLRETCRKIEVELAYKERLIDSHEWQNRALSYALKEQKLKEEQQHVQTHRYFHERVNTLLKMYGEGSSTEGASSSNEVVLRHREVRTEAPAAERTETKKRNESKSPFKRFLGRDKGRTPGPIPQKNLKTLQGSGKSSTATVTVEKNKLIIEQKEPRKSTSSKM